MKKYLYTVLLLALIHACSSNEYYPVTQKINGQIIEIKEHYASPRIALFDTIMVIIDSRSDLVVSVYSLPSFKRIANIGKRGKGPNELLAASGIDIENTHKVWIYDFYKMEFLAFDPDSTHPVQSVKLPREEKQAHLLYANFVSEHEYAAYRPDLNDGIFRLYRDGKCIKALGKLTAERKNIPDVVLSQVYMAQSKYNSRLKKMAVAYTHTNKIDIIDMESDVIKTIYDENYFEPSYNVNPQGAFSPTQNTLFAYRNIAIDDQYIYTLYKGESPYNETEAKEIHIFDWNGAPIRKYLLDYSAYALTVDSKNKKIYTISPDTNNGLVSYDIFQE
jgi:hypothetical protein